MNNYYDINEDSPTELLVEADNEITVNLRDLREAKAHINALLVSKLEDGEEISVGGQRYVLARRKRVKVRDLGAAVDAALTSVGGVVDEFVKLLSANALKYGSCKTVLGDRWGDHFEEELILGVDKKPIKEAKLVDEKYLS